MYSQEQLNEMYKSKKLFVFDLDDTLTPWNFVKEDCQKTIEILKKLKEDGKKITIASHNRDPVYKLEKYYNDIYKLFDKNDIIGPVTVAPTRDAVKNAMKTYNRYTFFEDRVCFYPLKSEMIKQLADKHNINLEDVIFFDDDQGHINDATEINITGVLVDKKKGILSVF